MKTLPCFVGLLLYISAQFACAEIVLLEDQRYYRNCWDYASCGFNEGDELYPEVPFGTWNPPGFTSTISDQGFSGSAYSQTTDIAKLAFTFRVTEDTGLEFIANLYEDRWRVNAGASYALLTKENSTVFDFQPHAEWDFYEYRTNPDYPIEDSDRIIVNRTFQLTPGDYQLTVFSQGGG